MRPPLAEIPILSTTCVGLDLDLTINSNPELFANTARELIATGGRVIIIVDRPSNAQEHSLLQLTGWGFKSDSVHFLPPIEEAVAACPHRDELGWYGSYLWHKVRIAEETGVTYYVDDDSLVRRLFRRFAPQIGFAYPFELYAREESISDSTSISDSQNQSDFQLLHPTPEIQQSAVEMIPFVPVKAYQVILRSGELEALYRVVTKLNGVVYTNGIIVVPATVYMDQVLNLLFSSEPGTLIELWWETQLGSHA